jgi:DNA-binding SARP family transcriptional activator
MSVRVRLLGGFEVDRDGVPVARDAWGRRQAAQLVQLLALTRDRRMHREQVIDALWPGLSWDAAGPRLHKAAHYARRALDDQGAVVLRHELVALSRVATTSRSTSPSSREPLRRPCRPATGHSPERR